MNLPREVWGHIATAARRHAGFDPRQLALVTSAARQGVLDTTTGWPSRLQDILDFGNEHIRTARKSYLRIWATTDVYLRHGRNPYDAALSALTGGTGTFKPNHREMAAIRGDSPHPDEFGAWCAWNLEDVCDATIAEEYFTSWHRIFQYYDPVAKAWLRKVCSDERMDLGLAWAQARKDYLISKGIPVNDD